MIEMKLHLIHSRHCDVLLLRAPSPLGLPSSTGADSGLGVRGGTDMAPEAPLGVCEGSLSLPLFRWLDWPLPHDTHPRCGLFSGDPNECVCSDQPVTVDRRVVTTKKQQKQKQTLDLN